MVMYYAYWEQKEEWNWGLILIVVTVVVMYFTGYDISGALADTAAGLSTALGVSMSTAYIIMAVSYLAAMGVFGEDYILLGQIATLAITVGTSSASLGANMHTANIGLQVMQMMNSYEMRHILEEAKQIAELGMSQELLKDEIQDGLDEEYEASGYYYSYLNRQYIQQALINIKKVDHLETMPSAEYYQKVLKTVSPRHNYRLQYNYT